MKHIKKFNEERYLEDDQKYKVVEDFLQEYLGNYRNPVDQEDLPELLIEFGKKVWIHLGEQGWGESSLNGYEEWIKGE